MFYLLVTILVWCVVPGTGQAPGASLILTNNGIAAAGAFAAPLLQAELLQLTLPDQKFNEVVVDIHLNDIHVTQVTVGASAVASGSGVSVSLSLSAFHLAASYQAWVVGIPAGSGPCDVEVDATASVTVVVTADCTAGGPLACKPHLTAENTAVNVGNLSPVCKGVAGQVLDALVDLFRGAVKQSLTDTATATITSVINTAANQALQKAVLDIPIQGGEVLARFDLTGAAPPSGASGAYLSLPVLGDAVLAANTSTRAPFPLPVLPPGPFAHCATSYLQLALSQFSLESLGWTMWRVGALASVVPHTILPPSFPIQLNTTDVALLAPGLASAFPHQWMQLDVGLLAPPTANVSAAAAAAAASEGGLSLAAPLSIAFQALPPTGPPQTAFTLGCPLGLAVSLGIGGGGSNITANVTTAACQLTVTNSSVGTVDAGGLALLVDFVLTDFLLPLANAVLNVGFPLPSLDGLQLSGASIFYATGFAGVCTNFSYT